MAYKSWAEYKASSDSLYASNSGVSGSIIANYNTQSNIARQKFNVELFNANEIDNKLMVEKYQVLTEMITKDMFQNSINEMTEGFKNLQDTTKDSYKMFQSALQDIIQKKENKEDVKKSIAQFKKYVKLLDNAVNKAIPDYITKIINNDHTSLKRVKNLQTMQALEGSQAAVTYFKKMKSHIKELDKYIKSLGENEFNIGEKSFSDSKLLGMKGGNLAQSYGGGFALINGQIFEGVVKRGIESALGSLGEVMNVGGQTDEEGKRQKQDIQVNIAGKQLTILLDKIGKKNGKNSESFSFAENVQLGVSVKMKRKSDSNTYLQTGFGTVMALDEGSIPDNLKSLMFQYFRLGGSLKDTGDSKMLPINQFITSLLANKILGDNIHLMAFADEVITKYDFLTYLGQNSNRYLRIVDKSSGRAIPSSDSATMSAKVNINS